MSLVRQREAWAAASWLRTQPALRSVPADLEVLLPWPSTQRNPVWIHLAGVVHGAGFFPHTAVFDLPLPLIVRLARRPKDPV